MRGRFTAALAAAVLVAIVGAGLAPAPPVAAASRTTVPTRIPAEPMSPKKGLLQQHLTTGRAVARAMPQVASSVTCDSTGRTVASPNIGASRNNLNGIAAVAPNDVWTVGTYINGSSVFQTLAEHWDGSAWSVITTPNVGAGNNVLAATAALSAGDVWAVGFSRPDNSSAAQPLTEHWNGNGWTVVPTPPRTSASSIALYGVSADASNDVWAVGIAFDSQYSAQPFVLRWNGSVWAVAVAPVAQVRTGGLNLSGLNGVKVLSANDVLVVGDGADFTGTTQVSPDTAFSNRWNGSFWSSISVPVHPNSDFLIDVQGTANDLWTVGGQGQAGSTTSDNVLIEHLTGTGWTDSPGATPGLSANLFGLGYLAADNIYAVGVSATANPGTAGELDSTVIERWNGSNWSLVSSENPSANDGLVAIAAISANDVWTAGFMTLNGYPQTLTEIVCALPVVTNVVPSSGTAGTTVAITGSGFSRAIDVEFGSTPAFTFHVVSDTQITAVSPGHKAGTVDIRVTVQGTSATSSADQFTYQVARTGSAAEPGTAHFQSRTPVPPPPVFFPTSPRFRTIARGAPIPI